MMYNIIHRPLKIISNETFCYKISKTHFCDHIFSESNLTDHYRSNDMISGKTSSMSTRDDLQNSTANIWVIYLDIVFLV